MFEPHITYKKFEFLLPNLTDACIIHIKNNLKILLNLQGHDINEFMSVFVNKQLRDQGVEASIEEIDFLCMYLALNCVLKAIDNDNNDKC
jgi:hypothetical protein